MIFARKGLIVMTTNSIVNDRMLKIGIKDVHQRVLEIAKAFDKICVEHRIPYYMLGGTMLGAIRHKGFIPWDDDMDFGVPIEYYNLLESVLVSELPQSFRCCTYKNHPAVLHNFMKVEDLSTCIDDKAVDLPIDQKLGLNIDIFPLNKCQLRGKRERMIRNYATYMGIIYNNSITHSDSVLRRGIKTILRVLFGSSPAKMQRRIEKLLLATNEGDYLANLLGRWKAKEIIPVEWYGSGVRYVFEDTTFVGLQEYDKYLTQLYGNYMSLPPQESQIAHVENVYLR